MFGPEYYVSLELSVTSWPSSSGVNALRFEDGSTNIINIFTQSSGQFRVATKLEAGGSVQYSDVSSAALNTFYRIEMLQTQVLDKVLYSTST